MASTADIQPGTTHWTPLQSQRRPALRPEGEAKDWRHWPNQAVVLLGPGAICKIDWAPLAKKHLQGRQVILHTDSAKSYKAKVDGVHHNSVVHCKKLITLKNGKKKWNSPPYVRVVIHRLRDGTQLKVKAGTQYMDRAWRFIKDRSKLNKGFELGPKQSGAAFVQPSMSTGCGAKISRSKLEI